LKRVANHRFLHDRGGAYYVRRAGLADAREGFDGKTEVMFPSIPGHWPKHVIGCIHISANSTVSSRRCGLFPILVG